MASARTASASRRVAARSARTARTARSIEGAAGVVRWDRVGRIALLLVLFGVLALYVRPGLAYIGALRDAKHKRADIARLESETGRLRARRAALRNPSVIEVEARRLGMVRPGERPYVVAGLPGERPAP